MIKIVLGFCWNAENRHRAMDTVRWRTLLLLLLDGQHWWGSQQSGLRAVRAEFIFPELPQDFSHMTEINIGFIESIMSSADSRTWCGGEPHFELLPEFVAFAIELANNNSLLPNNLKLGFVLHDDCLNRRLSVAQSLSFTPQMVCPESGHASKQAVHDVVAVIGCSTSNQTINVAQVLGAFKLPLVSVLATSDTLSQRFPYFLRVVPPDRVQFQAIAKLIARYSWSYISLVFMPDLYGLNGLAELQKWMGSSVCLAVEHAMRGESKEEAMNIARLLVQYHDRARVVVLIALAKAAKELITATGSLLPNATFVWIATDDWSPFVTQWTDIHHLLADSLLVKIKSADVPEFDAWLMHRTLRDASPWLRDRWGHLLNCSVDNATCNDTMTVAEIPDLPKDSFAKLRGYYLDAIFMVANATSRVLQQNGCDQQEAFAARACITGSQLLQELKATRQQGYSGWLELDKYGDRYGLIQISQLRFHSANVTASEVVFLYDSRLHKLIDMDAVRWSNQILEPGSPHPVSRCSSPCQPNEMQMVQTVKCCWTCKPCAVNNYVASQGMDCTPCQQFTWPDPDTNYTTCRPIPVTILRFDSLTGILQINLSGLGLLACLTVAVFFLHHCHCRLVVSSSRSLSVLMLLVIAAGYSSVIVFHLPPSVFVCKVKFYSLCVTMSALFGSLLARTLHVYLESCKAGSKPTRCAWFRQVALSVLLPSLQAVICLLVIPASQQWDKQTMENAAVPVVEYMCWLPEEGVLSFVLYNGLLVVLTTLLAARTPSFIDTFNENRMTLLCMCATLITALCFIPAYTIATRQEHRTHIFTMLLWLCNSLVLTFLFLTKVYSIWQGQGHIPCIHTDDSLQT